jgi:hypothetical protein
MIESRFVYRGNAVGLAGRIVRIDPKSDLDLLIPVQGASSLPVIGGRSESNVRRAVVSIRRPFVKILASARSVQTLAESVVEREGKPFETRVRSDVRSARLLDQISVARVHLNMTSTHVPGDPYPRISLADSEITGLKLGRFPITVTLDLKTFKAANTKEELAAIYAKNASFRKRKAKKFNTPEDAQSIQEYTGGYFVCSIVESISGKLPEGAYIDENGYTIVWPGVGKVVLGEMLISQNSRRLTMVRVHFGSPTGGDAMIGEGDVNGSSVP